MGGRGAANAAHRRGRLSASANGVHRHRGRTVVRPRRTAPLPGERRYRMTTRVPLARNRVGVLASGAFSTPEGPSRTKSRTKRALRRRILAGRTVVAAITYKNTAPASDSRRRVHFRSGRVRNLSPGVISAPEGPSRTESRREPPLRRHRAPAGPVPKERNASSTLSSPR